MEFPRSGETARDYLTVEEGESASAQQGFVSWPPVLPAAMIRGRGLVPQVVPVEVWAKVTTDFPAVVHCDVHFVVPRVVPAVVPAVLRKVVLSVLLRDVRSVVRTVVPPDVRFVLPCVVRCDVPCDVPCDVTPGAAHSAGGVPWRLART